ncbi:MAG: hypothetical protein IPL40_10405 [Proteobacteria bacterium]|nr:hypothetical protein [Pseudomonadota bacterium]
MRPPPSSSAPLAAAAAVSWLIADELGEAPPAASAAPAAPTTVDPRAVAAAAARAPAPAAAREGVAVPAEAPGLLATGSAAPVVDVVEPAAQDERAAQLAEDLFGDLVAPEALNAGAPRTPAEVQLAEVRSQTERLDRVRLRWVEQRRAADAAPESQELRQLLQQARGEAQAALDAACNLIEAMPDDEALADPRRDLVDAYFRLERGISPEGPASEADEAAAAARARRMQRLGKTRAVGRRGWGRSRAWNRSAKLGLMLGVAVAARVAYFLAVEEPAKVMVADAPVLTVPGAVLSQIDPAAQRSLKPRSMPPQVRMVLLRPTQEGLQVDIAATSDSPASLRYSYTWWENGKIFAEGRDATLPIKNLTAGASYRVEIEVADDKGRTMAKSEALKYGGAAGPGLSAQPVGR